ncbi:MAG: aldehyde dehydrogenase family protein, partial [Bdellovibrionales bacterium]|nr:aldehyde dehydrogenase family protein [Bdellovibrionales bacterium]NQZ18709.1 aldehyde dehydrogenase family protein [Bdellovibrionales bacterium]
VASVICSGNTTVVIFDQPGATMISALGEVLATSDVPGGVVNLLSGRIEELYKHLSGHMEVQSVSYNGESVERFSDIKELAIENMKRVVKWNDFEIQDLQPIAAFTEYKTIWHPVGL